MSSLLVFTLKTERFKKASFSKLYFFIGCFKKHHFSSGVASTGGKNEQVWLRFHVKTDQCERGLRPVLKVAPRRAEPSEFRSILPGSARRDSYKTNLTLGSTESNHMPKASRLGRPGATYKANFSRATSNFSFNERMFSSA